MESLLEGRQHLQQIISPDGGKRNDDKRDDQGFEPAGKLGKIKPEGEFPVTKEEEATDHGEDREPASKQPVSKELLEVIQGLPFFLVD